MEKEKQAIIDSTVNMVINKYGFYSNRNAEDLRQDMKVKLLEQKHRFLHLEGNDLEKMLYVISRNHFLRILVKKSFIVENNNKCIQIIEKGQIPKGSTGPSDYKDGFNGQVFNLESYNDGVTTEDKMFAKELQSLLNEYIEKCVDEEEKRFLTLCLSSSEEIQVLLNGYKEKSIEESEKGFVGLNLFDEPKDTIDEFSIDRLKSKKFISPVKIGRLIGLTHFRINKFQTRLKKYLIKKGYFC